MPRLRAVDEVAAIIVVPEVSYVNFFRREMDLARSDLGLTVGGGEYIS